MPLIHDRAIVLRRLDYSETSEILVLITRTLGKVRAIAKGVRKSTKSRFRPGIDLLEEGVVVLSARETGQQQLATITEWKQTRTFWGLRERVIAFHAAIYAADIVSGLTEEWDAHADLYESLCAALDGFGHTERPLRPLVTFQRTLLRSAGVFPRTDACVCCGSSLDATPDIYFSSFEGGLLCRDCEPARLEKRLVKVSRVALKAGALSTDADVAGAFDLLDYHISHLMGRAPASQRFLSDAARSVTGARKDA